MGEPSKTIDSLAGAVGLLWDLLTFVDSDDETDDISDGDVIDTEGEEIEE